MNRFGFALSMIAVVGSASWAYHVNYRTEQAFGRVDALRARIAAEREATGVLRVEWAYLNNPQRLATLVALNNEKLHLEPMTPENFSDVAAVPYPPRPPEVVPPAESPGIPDDAAAPDALIADAGSASAAAPAIPAAATIPAPEIAAIRPAVQPAVQRAVQPAVQPTIARAADSEDLRLAEAAQIQALVEQALAGAADTPTLAAATQTPPPRPAAVSQ